MGKTSIVRGLNGKPLALRHTPLAIACAAAFLFSSQASLAEDVVAAAPQDAPATPSDADADAGKTEKEKEEARRKEQAAQLAGVKVVGIRGGIESAIDTKQDSNSIVESISAEDIGKLPDSSIAESIARLPGLTAQRDRGRATQIHIRGLNGDFAGTTLNGREQVSTGDNRAAEFDQYPSELLSSVVVYKTPDASLVGQGLSGTVDLRTVRPLDFPNRVVSLNYRADQNKGVGGKDYGNRYSFSYIDQFADNTVGLAIGYAHLDSPSPAASAETWGYSCPPAGCTPGGGNVYRQNSNLERDGWMVTLQFRPNDFYETSIDWFHSKFDKTLVRAGVEMGIGSPLPGATYGADGALQDGTFSVRPIVFMRSDPINSKNSAWGWNNVFHVSDKWEVTADLSWSDVENNFRNVEAMGSTSGNVLVDLHRANGFYEYQFATDLGDPNILQLMDAGGWGQDGYFKEFQVNDTLRSFRLDAERSFDSGWISSVEFGVNHARRSKDKSSNEAKLCLDSCGDGETAPWPGTTTSFNFGGIDNLAIFDADSFVASGAYNFLTNHDQNITAKNWEVDEEVTTWFAQVNIDTDLGPYPLRGNFGFQYVDVDQSSIGFSTYSGNPDGTPNERGVSYKHWLPSLNLALELPSTQFLRFAAARQMARPRMDQMRASFDVGIGLTGCGVVAGPAFCAGGGNPGLKPWLANAYDMAYEKYFTTDLGHKGYVSVAYFYKELVTYIRDTNVTVDFAGLPLPPIAPGQIVGVTYPAGTIGNINMPFNGDGGSLKGWELAVSVPLDVLWKPLDGFGLQASYSDTSSSIQPDPNSPAIRLPGLSRYISNATVYYERGGFSVRYSQRKRSAYRGELRNFSGSLVFEEFHPETVKDAQVNYNFNSGFLEGLSLYLQVSNISDAPAQTTTTDGLPLRYFQYGRTTLLGFSYKF